VLNFNLVGLLVTSLMIAWPILDGCSQGFLPGADVYWRKDAILHAIPIGATIILFSLPNIVNRLKLSSR
jgi:hypothetical protein